MSETTKDDLLEVLQKHIGRGNGATAESLAATLGIPQRRVRKLISELRMNAHAVCGHPATGYFLAETREELLETCEFLRGRAMHSLTMESRLLNTTLLDLMGQMKLTETNRVDPGHKAAPDGPN